MAPLPVKMSNELKTKDLWSTDDWWFAMQQLVLTVNYDSLLLYIINRYKIKNCLVGLSEYGKPPEAGLLYSKVVIV